MTANAYETPWLMTLSLAWTLRRCRTDSIRSSAELNWEGQHKRGIPDLGRAGVAMVKELERAGEILSGVRGATRKQLRIVASRIWCSNRRPVSSRALPADNIHTSRTTTNNNSAILFTRRFRHYAAESYCMTSRLLDCELGVGWFQPRSSLVLPPRYMSTYPMDPHGDRRIPKFSTASCKIQLPKFVLDYASR